MTERVTELATKIAMEARVKLAEAEGAAAQEKAVKERTALVDALEALLPDFKQVCGDILSAAKPLSDTFLRHPSEVPSLLSRSRSY